MEITIIMPTYNRADLLRRSLPSLINQNYPKTKYEIIVVDDGSTDSTKKIVNNFSKKFKNIKHIKQENKGPATARNKGVAFAKGKIIAFTDDDCIADKNWLKNISKEFKNNPGLVGIEGKTIPTRRVGPFSHYIKNTAGGHYLTCNIAYKKSIIKKIKFDEKFRMAKREDSDLAFTLLEKGYKIKFSPKVIVKHAVFSSSFKSKLKEKKAFMYDVLLWKKHPRLYRKIIKFPFERFTPFYILFSILCFLSPLFFIALILTCVYEIHYRKWLLNHNLIRFLILQIIGSFIIIIYILYGFVKFHLNET